MCELLDLGPAREAVREDDDVGGRSTNGGKQLVLRNGDGYVVVTLLDTEVPGEATTAPKGCHAGTCLLQESTVRLPPQNCMVMAMGLDQDFHVTQVRRDVGLVARQKLGESHHSFGDPLSVLGGHELGEV